MSLRFKQRKTLVCISRYLPHSAGKKFTRTLEALPEKMPTNVHFKIAVSGGKKTPLETIIHELELKTQYYGHLKLPKQISILCKEAIEEGFDSFVLIDDDAYIPNLLELVRLVNEAFDKHHAGAAGPITRWRFWAKAKNDPAKAMFRPFTNSPWTSQGCQCYDVHMLKKALHLWKPLYDKLDWRSDHPMFITAHSLGHKPCEIYLPEYDHTGSATKFIYTEQEWEARMLRLVTDYTCMLRYTKQLDNGEFYKQQMYRLGELELLHNTKPLFKKSDVTTWKALAVEDFAETLRFYRPIAKERGML